MTQIREKVVITGVGVISPIGNDIVEFERRLLNGISGIGRLDNSFSELLDTRIVAQCTFDSQAHFGRQELALLDRVSQFALFSANQAIASSGLDLQQVDLQKAGVFVGTGMGGANATEEGYHRLFKENQRRLKPFTVLMAMNNAAASQVATRFQFAGSNFTYSNACASSAVAIGEAYQQIASGRCQVALAGGAEALLTFGTIKAWEALRTLAEEDANDASASCKPFSKNRTGLVLGEGAAFFVLESASHAAARGAKILAEIAGYGTSNDFGHITQPSVEGQSRAIQAALDDAGVQPDQIAYINAHGTGTILNDLTETKAIKQVFGQFASEIPVSSTKSIHGHLMGASAAIEVAACIVALHSQQCPPTMHLHEPDPECDLNYVANRKQAMPEKPYVMTNSFAFGGTSGVLILKKV